MQRLSSSGVNPCISVDLLRPHAPSLSAGWVGELMPGAMAELSLPPSTHPNTTARAHSASAASQMVPVPAAKTVGISVRCRTSHPPTLQMVKEALRAHDEKKGASVVAIKRFILAKYPTVDPIRLKYLLKQALSKGLSCGDLVRPHNSSAVGATGTFKVSQGCWSHRAGGRCWLVKPVKVSRGAPLSSLQAQPRAAEKPRSNRAKDPQTADQPQAHGPGPSGLPKAAAHRQAPRKGRSGPSTARDAQNAGESDSSSSAGAEAKAPRGKGKGKVPKGAQQEGPKAQGGQNKVKKPRATAGAGQGKARVKKAAPMAADRKAP
uniref:H15 domain-containing protein n=1 Tax=Zonotrichia albicollis TaxID=44394 RepID=A0A8D2M566_ZONAL